MVGLPGDAQDGPGVVIDALTGEIELVRRGVERAEEAANTAVRAAVGAQGQSDALTAQIAQLRSEVAGLAALGAQVATLADRVTALVTGLRHGSGATSEGQLSWFDADAERAASLLVDLGLWVHGVASQYRSVQQQLSNCWYRHPAAVESLNALRAAWFAAYRDPSARPSAAVDWHIRQLPGVADLLRDELRGCDELNHQPGGGYERDQRTDLAPEPDSARLAESAARGGARHR